MWNAPQIVPQTDASGPWELPWQSCLAKETQVQSVWELSAVAEANPEVGGEDMGSGISSSRCSHLIPIHPQMKKLNVREHINHRVT